MKVKFTLTMLFAFTWLAVSAHFAVGWATEASEYLPAAYVWFVIIGVALIPGFLISAMFFSNLLNFRAKKYPRASEPVTVIVCARNAEATVAKAIECICRSVYAGTIKIVAVDNDSTDLTKCEIERALHRCCACGVTGEYVFCPVPGKSHALNCGLERVNTAHFLTVDADTFLAADAIQKIMNNLLATGAGCAAGNLFAANPRFRFASAVQNYDYILSIAAIKRFQGSYNSTLVAQGAFSAYRTSDVRAAGGWEHCRGEDIVLTYRLLAAGCISTYEPSAAAYTTVPTTVCGLFKQRMRWAEGMIEGFRAVKPHEQPTCYSRYFEFLNLLIIPIDLAFIFGFIPGVILALAGCPILVGKLTLLAAVVALIFFFSFYLFQKRRNIPFFESLLGFVLFFLFFQPIQSAAALSGYFKAFFTKRCSKK